MSRKISRILKFKFYIVDEFATPLTLDDSIKDEIVLWYKNICKDSRKYIGISFNRIYIENEYISFEYYHYKNFDDFTLVSEYLKNLSFLETDSLYINNREYFLKLQSKFCEVIST